jgi:hypothetical protein
MFWKKKKNNKQDAIKEVWRRAMRMQRQHLEYLLQEGCIDETQLDNIVTGHRSTIADDYEPLLLSQAKPDYELQNFSYLEAAEGLFSQIAGELLPWNQTLEKLDPRHFGWFEKTSNEKLSIDLTVLTIFLRSQSLEHHFPEISLELEAEVTSFIIDRIGSDSLNFYLQLKQEWLRSLSVFENPLTSLAQSLQSRNCPWIGEDPLLELTIADIAIKNSWCFWGKMKMVGNLIP